MTAGRGDDLEEIDLNDEGLSAEERVSICEALDRILHKGVVLRGDVVLSVANIDLVYLGLQLVLCSTDVAIDTGFIKQKIEGAGR